MKFRYNYHRILLTLYLLSFFSINWAEPDIHQEIFTQIYTQAIWGKNDQGEGFSGGGSLLKYTKQYIHLLENFIKEHDVRSVVDAGCGDWEFSKYVKWGDIHYSGYDVVAHIIDKNIALFGKSNIEFFHLNFIKNELPSADLLLCKEVLQHLTNADILEFIPQLSNYKYCLITNEVYPKTMSSDNPDISVGGGHKIDLSKPPFNVEGKVVLNYRIGSSVHQVFLIDNTHGKKK